MQQALEAIDELDPDDDPHPDPNPHPRPDPDSGPEPEPEPKPEPEQALEAIDELTQHVDILIVVSNDKLLDIVPEGVPG